MKSLWLLLIVGLLGLTVIACGNDDGDGESDGDSIVTEGCQDASEYCDILGDSNVTDGTMDGQFNFSSKYCFDLVFALSGSDQSWSADLEVEDSSQTLSGPCSGTWTDDGDVTGQCVLTGHSNEIEIDVTISGMIGDNAACGTWSNEVGQNGDWWAQR